MSPSKKKTAQVLEPEEKIIASKKKAALPPKAEEEIIPSKKKAAQLPKPEEKKPVEEVPEDTLEEKAIPEDIVDIGPEGEVKEKDLTEPRLWREARELEAEKEEPADLELEIPLETLEAQEVVDDPVRMYLHEIGRVRLLTAVDERTLARKMTEGKRIKEITEEWNQKYGRPPTATEIVLTILREICQASDVIGALQKELKISAKESFVKAISNAKLRDTLDGGTNLELIEAVAKRASKTPMETERVMITLSLNSNLLPRQILGVIGNKACLVDLDTLIQKTDFMDSIGTYEEQLKTYLQNIKEESEKAEAEKQEEVMAELFLPEEVVVPDSQREIPRP